LKENIAPKQFIRVISNRKTVQLPGDQMGTLPYGAAAKDILGSGIKFPPFWAFLFPK